MLVNEWLISTFPAYPAVCVALPKARIPGS